MKWKEDEITYLEKNYPKNISKEKISENLRKTVKAIVNKASRLKISRPRFPSNKSSKRMPRKLIDKRYYKKNKNKIFEKKMTRRKILKKELVNLLGGKCKICGYNKSAVALDFHHIKEKDICMTTLLKNNSKKKLLKEAKKCVLLCANCHRELHFMGT